MLKISSLSFSSPLILAPLAGYSDLPFRLLCREYGAGFCVSEMISCHGLVYQQKKTVKMLATVAQERPVSFQLFGADIHAMAKAANILNEFQPDLVDINMGCPVKKVTKKGAGAALMSTPEIARTIIEEVVKNSESPITVKIRKGVDQKNISCVEFAKMAEDSGASAVAIHGRTWSQGFTGTADWHSIAAVKQAVTIPVIGNGDVTSFSDAIDKLSFSKCDGVMIGRNALGNPWIFSESGRPENYQGILKGVIRHLDLMSKHIEVDRLLAVVKNHISRYFRTLPGSSNIRKQIFESPSFHALDQMMHSLMSCDNQEK